jgi:hypothetical protein
MSTPKGRKGTVSQTDDVSPTGGATKTAPATWGHPDLATYYTLKPTFAARSATRLIPSPTGVSSGASKKTNVAAIAGGVVGGLVALIAILSLILFCLHQRKKALKEDKTQTGPPPPPPVELGTTVPQEMSGVSPASKYVHMHEQADPIALSNYPGPAQLHSQSASQDYNYPYSAQGPPSYGHAPPYSSPTESEHGRLPHHQGNTELFIPNNGANHNLPPSLWDQQASYPQSATTAQSLYAYPTPTSPRQSPNDTIQQVPIYYPRPTDPASRSQRSHPSFSDNRGSPTGTQYSGEGQPRNISTMNTPAHFYAQPTSRNSPGTDDGQGRNLEDRRPVQGRFVEDGHM